MKKKHIILSVTIATSLFISSLAFAVEFDQNSAKITNRFFPATIGRWSYMLGVGNSVGSAIYGNVVGIEEVSGAQIGAQTFNNVKCLKWNHIWTKLNDEDEFATLWIAQDTQGNLWILKAYFQFSDATYTLGTIFKSMFMPAVPDVGDSASITMPETATHYCRVVAVDISINTNFGSYNSCIKTHCFDESSIESGEYYCPNVGEVRIFSFDDGNPQDILDLKEFGTASVTKEGTSSDTKVIVIPIGN